LKRRKVLRTIGAASALGLGGAALIGFSRGLRFPVLQFEPAWSLAHTSAGESGSVKITAKGAVVLPVGPDGLTRLRASGPQPGLDISASSTADVQFVLENIHPDAVLDSNSSGFAETGNGLTRTISGRAPAGETIQLRWQIPDEMNYRVAIIGDSGGGMELDWCIKRAAALGANFVIHLGDVYYEPSDITTAPVVLNKGAVPVYMAIGNHDFHKGFDLLHKDFTNTVGPRNASFRLGRIRYANIDTAAAMYPPSRGERAALLSDVITEVQSASAPVRNVFFSHMPITDPRSSRNPEHSHNVPEREHAWLREQLGATVKPVLLAGHVHESAELDDQGIYTYVAGEGLAHRDIIARKQIAQILLADVTDGERMDFSWKPMQMPGDIHCNQRVQRLMRAAGNMQLASEYCRTADS